MVPKSQRILEALDFHKVGAPTTSAVNYANLIMPGISRVVILTISLT